MLIEVRRPVAAGVLGAVACAALLAAFVVEHGLGVAPCELCLLERWPWRVLIGLALIALFLPGSGGRAALALAIPVLLVSAGLGVLHVGVEQHLWPSPFPSCRGGTFSGGAIAAQLDAMPLRAAKPCDAPYDIVPALPVSMATLDLLLSLAMIGWTLPAIGRRPTRRRFGRTSSFR